MYLKHIKSGISKPLCKYQVLLSHPTPKINICIKLLKNKFSFLYLEKCEAGQIELALSLVVCKNIERLLGYISRAGKN